MNRETGTFRFFFQQPQRLVLLSIAAITAASPTSVSAAATLVRGLDHIPVAVADLDAAAEHYRRLGFTLKPGRPHENGVRNQHVKFADGTEIELITASQARDALTTEYLEHLAHGDGPAFLALFAPDMDPLARVFDGVGRAYRRSDGLLSFPVGDDLRYVFFGQRNASPTDRPEHFEHANGAEALIGVWLAGDDLSAERDLLIRLGATIGEEALHVPDETRATVARLPQAEIALLPGSRQWTPGRRIVGATLRTRSLESLRRVLASGGGKIPATVGTGRGASLFLEPTVTHGLWLEFREPK